ncbi:flavin oxidoreductase [Chromohalobacter japonicus]|uniref:Flavin oxidoreductase n=1 Tax=Chromohalobacter japonicus TaxID=223900 RepID=A0A1Q8THU8_9GAMM|nr:flavin reductase family protein [Chromohalobacter japonicus]OLO13262.1 flavin oxidoreductase [Chromohalobacter japonicus]
MNNFREFKAPDRLDMRRTMGRFITGVAIITTRDGDELYGMTINSLTSISLEPPILMVSLNFGARTTEALVSSSEFAISILGAKQEAVARKFAARGGARFEAGEFEYTINGLPVIKDALSQAECNVVNQYDIGDHQVFFGQVASCKDRDGLGLAFSGGKFGSFRDLGHEEIPWIY